MRLVFLSGQYPPRTKGGGEISTHLIARALVQRGHQVQVITEGERREERELNGVKIFQWPLGLTAKPLLEARASRKAARQLDAALSSLGADKSTLLQAHDFRSALALTQLSNCGPLVGATVRDYAQICGTTNAVLIDGARCTCSATDVFKTQRVKEARFPRNLARAWQYHHNTPWRRAAFRKIPYQIYISQAQLGETKRQQDLSGVRTQVIYNPVPDDYLKEPMEPGQAGTVLYVGRVESYKGVGLLLAAWREIVRQRLNAQLKIVGEGAQLRDYDNLVQRQGLQHQVSFLGFVPWERLRRIYDEASVLVSPHVWVEPFGRGVAEAMARGRVVVTANAGGPAEMIRASQSGLEFKRGSAVSLAESLQQALSLSESRRRKMSLAARNWARENLSETVVAGQYEDFYGSILDSK